MLDKRATINRALLNKMLQAFALSAASGAAIATTDAVAKGISNMVTSTISKNVAFENMLKYDDLVNKHLLKGHAGTEGWGESSSLPKLSDPKLLPVVKQIFNDLWKLNPRVMRSPLYARSLVITALTGGGELHSSRILEHVSNAPNYLSTVGQGMSGTMREYIKLLGKE